MAKRKKTKKEVISVINQVDLIKNSAGKLNKGTDHIVRQGTGYIGSKKRKEQLKKKTTRQYLSDYDRDIKIFDTCIIVWKVFY